MRSRSPSLLNTPAVAVLAVTVAGFGGAWSWACDLASHFRCYWLVAAVVTLIVAARRPRSLACLSAGLALALNAWSLSTCWLPGPVTPAVSAGAKSTGTLPPLSLVSCNLFIANPDKARAVAYLRDRQPDVAVLLEVDDAWAVQLAGLDEIYPFRLVAPRSDGFGLAILSRWPLADARVVDRGGSSSPLGAATLRFHGRDVRLFATHPHSPLTPARWTSLVEDLRMLADMAAAAPRPCIVAGDFNATPWSAAYRVITAVGGLRDTALGHGVQATWNARLPAPRIPIDHVFTSPDVAVARRTIGPDVGSDHFPVEVTLVLPPAN